MRYKTGSILISGSRQGEKAWEKKENIGNLQMRGGTVPLTVDCVGKVVTAASFRRHGISGCVFSQLRNLTRKTRVGNLSLPNRI